MGHNPLDHFGIEIPMTRIISKKWDHQMKLLIPFLMFESSFIVRSDGL
ncbi:hypothetical protein SAMN05443550_110170 [Pedobacter hartonius]|uniref:Uncharacterized protein n=1 Tax=Pedobacter hartonius TaxID=425514 RepID=A0A1H4GL95_9SPHI|nr:hypothetical protein SAMN05443550_110170 [Pedobacter hartonius]